MNKQPNTPVPSAWPGRVLYGLITSARAILKLLYPEVVKIAARFYADGC